MADYIGALDQGTTSTRFMIFNHEGRVVGSHQLEHDQLHPRPGWVEHDPLEIWRNAEVAIKKALNEAGLSGSGLAAVGVTNQRETTMVWDAKTGKPYANAIVWQDTRTDRLIRHLAEDGGQDRFRGKTGLPLATYFSGPKLSWLLQHVDGLRSAAEAGDAKFGTIDSWLIWNLTGGVNGGIHCTDVTNASRTLLMNLEALSWDQGLLDAMDVPAIMLPEIRPSIDTSYYGLTAEDGPFGAEVPVCGALGDQQAALYGQACFKAGEAKNTYGTGCFVLLNTGEERVSSEHGLITTVAYQHGDEPAVYALEGSIAIAGALISWLRDNLGILDSAQETGALAQSVEDNGGCYFVPAFSGLFAPYWRDDARGVITGLTHYVKREHIVRAALEATAYQTSEVIEAMQQDSAVEMKSLKVDGGMVRNDFLMQFQADILDSPVIRPEVSETTALGAAYAAGRAVGYWADEEALRRNWRMDERWEPSMSSEERGRLLADWRKAVERSFGWSE
ncbi:MAG: glycerol kinase GlpK [Anaerolineales bacterium]